MSLEQWERWADSVRDKAMHGLAALIERDAKNWTATGRGQFKCCSPLRHERTPSFYVYADQGRWHDFGTSKGGDAIAYIRERDQCSYREAMSTLAVALGMEDYGGGSAAQRIAPEDLVREFNADEDARTIFELMTEIARICAWWIEAPDNKVRKHLREHYALSDATIDAEMIGYAPECLWHLVRDRMPNVHEATLMKTGFFANVMSHATAQAGRILFPYWRDGLVHYTIGRHFFAGADPATTSLEEWDRGKYKKHLTWNEEKRPWVSKLISNELLWNEDCGRHLNKNFDLLISEGITDALILKQIGFYVMSPVTISISDKQIARTIEYARRARSVVIINDNDVNARGERPGWEGAKRMLKIMWEAKIPVRVGTLPKPEGVSKIDVNEYVAARLRAVTA